MTIRNVVILDARSYVLILLLLLLFGFKIVQVLEEPKSTWPDTVQRHPKHLVFYAITRRLDTANYWMLFAVTVGAARLARLRRELNLNRAPREWAAVALATLMLALLTSIYVFFAWIEPGTFFWEPQNPYGWTTTAVDRVKVLQRFEGGLNCVAILVFVSVLHQAIRTGNELTRRLGDHEAPPEILEYCRTLSNVCLSPLLSFPLYFLAYQVIMGAKLPTDELVALSSAIIIYAIPCLGLYLRWKSAWGTWVTLEAKKPGADVIVRRRPSPKVHSTPPISHPPPSPLPQARCPGRAPYRTRFTWARTGLVWSCGVLVGLSIRQRRKSR